MFQKGQSGNPKGRPRIGDSLAECVRARWDPARRQKAIDALAKKAAKGDVVAFSALARVGWPDESKGVLVDVEAGNGPLTVRFGGRYKPEAEE